MDGLVCRGVELLLPELALGGSRAGARLEGNLVAPALVIVACGHTWRGAAAQLLVVELEWHTIIVLLAPLLQELLLYPRTRRLLGQLRNLHWHLVRLFDRWIVCSTVLSCALIVMSLSARGRQHLVIVLEPRRRARLLRLADRLFRAIARVSGVGNLGWNVRWVRSASLLRVMLLLSLLRYLLGVHL